MVTEAVAHAKVARAEKVKRVLIVATFVLVLALLLLIVSLTGQVRNTQLEGTPTGKKLLQSAETIEDCTQANGECYERNLQRSAEVIGDLNRVIVIAASCASGPDEKTVQRIQECVINRLAASQP